MLEIRNFQKGDFEAIRNTVESGMGKFNFNPDSLITEYSFTGLKDDRIVGCAGFTPRWNGVVCAWLLLIENITLRDWVLITDKVEKTMEDLFANNIHRIEATVDSGFDAGHRWAKRLGLKPEGIMAKYSPSGDDHVLYARVK